jgi:hypothetical protein
MLVLKFVVQCEHWVEGGNKLYRVTNQNQAGEEGVGALDGSVGTVTVVERAICSKTGRRKYNKGQLSGSQAEESQVKTWLWNQCSCIVNWRLPVRAQGQT